jgi:membrane fusion protein, macrolide-specific efflux system
MRSKTTTRVLVVLGVLLVLVIVSVGPFVVQQITKKTGNPALATAAVQSFPITATANGTLLPQSVVNVNFAVSGVIAGINVQTGQAVRAGDRLAELNDSSQQAALQAAETAQSSAQQVLSALESSGGTAVAIANARAQLGSTTLQLQRARADEASTTLTAPQAGTVLQVNSQVGDNVTAGATTNPSVPGSSNSIVNPNSTATAFIVIGSATSFQVVAPFSQQAATQLASGQAATVNFDALPGTTMAGKVSAVASSATSMNGVPVFYAAIIPSGTDPRLKSGMTATVTVTVGQAKNVLAVPSQAVYFGNNGAYVSVWKNNSNVPTPVTTGLIGNQEIQITSGLTAGEQVVLSAPQTLPTPSSGVSGTGQ